MDAPRNDLIRADMGALPQERQEGDGRTLFGHFSVFERWYEIDSWEGRFLERTVPGAFKKTMAEGRERMRVLYDHGQGRIGNEPLGPIRAVSEDDDGAFYEVSLLDTEWNRNTLLPLLRSDPPVLGSSFRFRTIQDQWVDRPKKSAHNPDGIPERTLTEVAVAEFGPVTFGASLAATAGVRSRADLDLWQSLDEEGRRQFQALRTRAFNPATSSTPTGAAPGAGSNDSTEPPGAALGLTHNHRAAFLRSLDL